VFRRNLSDEFICELGELYEEKTSWWYSLVNDPQVFVAIRNDAINAYAGGASIARITWNSGRLRLEVHLKFLVLPNMTTIKSPYINLLETRQDPIQATVVDNPYRYVDNLQEIKAAAERLTGEERIGEINIAGRCKCVLDVETTFSGSDVSDDDPGRLGGRIDIVALNGKGCLILTEAKLYSNSEIKSKPTHIPDVCDQLVEYHEWARSNRKEIIAAYVDVQKFRKRLNLRSCEDDVIPRDLDLRPRLLVFGFDRAHQAALTDVKERIVKGLQGRIPDFDKRYIQTVGRTSSVREHHLDGSLSPGSAA
jgi:hypothetical protein